MAALEAKLAGNVAFKAGNLPLALKSYSSAIELDPGVAVYYLNRSAVYLKQQRWSDVEADTTKAIQLDSKLLMKASFRRGIARREAGDLDGARGDFHIALTAGAAPAEVAAELDKIPKVAKKTKLPPESVPSKPPIPATESTSTPSPSTARLRAALNPPTAPITSTPPVPSSTATKPVINDDSNEFMKASSSRRLTKSTAPAPTPVLENNGFAAKKEKRNERITGSIGDFRRNGVQEDEPKVVSSPVVPQRISPPPQRIATPPAARTPTQVTISNQVPISAIDFETRWGQLSTPESRRNYLKNLVTASVDLQKLFGDCLSPEIIEEIIRCLSTESMECLWTFELLKGLTRVRRFGVAIQFLEEGDRAVLKSVFERTRAEIDSVAKSWES